MDDRDAVAAADSTARLWRNIGRTDRMWQNIFRANRILGRSSIAEESNLAEIPANTFLLLQVPILKVRVSGHRG